ncbi:MAG: methionine synthase [Bacteroidales bacterium]|nr:methionine synthase [Bacteroidales bacterium]
MIYDRLAERILILDGAMGTLLQRYELHESINDLVNISRPEIVLQIHKAYIEAGADIIETNTFNSNGISLAKYGCADQTYSINYAAARIACNAAALFPEREIYVAGCMGPTSKMLSLSSDVNHPESRDISFDDLTQAYKEQVRGLIDGGVRLLLIETIFDSLNAKAAVFAISEVQQEKHTNLPVMASATVNYKSGRILTGQSVEALYHTLNHYPLLSFGLNCSFGAREMKPIIESLAPSIDCSISIYPNAGLPNEMGRYDESPKLTAQYLRDMAEDGLLNIAGGCCGTTPDHIREIRSALADIRPRKITQIKSNSLTVTGLDCIAIDRKEQNFINIGERTNVAGSKKFADLIKAKQYEEAAGVARKQIEDGASIIDINMDDPMIESAAEMEHFIRYISTDPDISKAAFMIDSSDWETILAGLKNAPGKCIVNSISLKEGEKEFLRKAKEIKRIGAAVIVMAFDEKGQATTYERKIEICERAYKLLTEKGGYKPVDIIFDVNILTIGTGIKEHDNYAVDFIRAVKWIKEHLEGCHTSGGVSNISFAYRGNNKIREAMHSVFLYHAINSGLDMAIVNPAMLRPYNQIEPDLLRCVEDVVLNSDTGATERLTALAEKIKFSGEDTSAAQKGLEWRDESFEKRLVYALTRGIPDFLDVDLREALNHLSPMEIIEGPLLKGMEKVGFLFSEGKMFLPQVIKTAKIMRSAVNLLQPELKKGSSTGSFGQKKIILATAKGDVHDIGKNILSVVLSCNSIEVIDLGVMVDNNTIMEAIHKHNPDFVGISGLITPSLSYMEDLCKMMEQEQMKIPLLIGGATTSALHTAVKLAPLYSYCVGYTSSASDCANLVNHLIRDREGTIEKIKLDQLNISQMYLNKDENYISLEAARKKAVKYPLESFRQAEAFGEHNLTAINLPVETVVDKIDWTYFFSFWGFKGKYPEIIYQNEEAEKCYESAIYTLNQMISGNEVELSVMVRFFDACSENEAIVLNNGFRFEMERSTSDRTKYESLADFFPPRESGQKSTIGLFVIKVADRIENDSDKKDYDHFLRASLCARITEAAAEWMQEQISEGTNVIRPAFGYPACPDHSLKRIAFNILDAENKLGIALTSSYAIIPTTSLCGMIISHPQAKYIHIREENEGN